MVDWEELFIVYKDDDDSVKSRVAFIQKEQAGVNIKITAEGIPFFLPYNRVLKIKPRTQKDYGHTTP